MAKSAMSQVERFQQRNNERVRAARVEQQRQLEAAKATKAERIVAAELQAESRLADATFKEIFYTHDNEVHTYRPDRSRSVLFTEVSSEVARLATDDPGVALQLESLRAQIETTRNSARRLEDRERDLRRQIAEAEAAIARNFFRNIDLGTQLPGWRDQLIAVVNNRNQVDRDIDRLESQHVELAGRTTSTSVLVNAAVGDVVVDAAGEAAYWARWAAPFSVSRHVFAETEGEAGTNSIIYPNRPGPVTSVALLEFDDGSDPHLYWLEGDRSLMRGSIDGAMTPEEVLDIEAPGQGGLWQLAIDSYHRHVYWTNTISIWRADLDHDNVQSTVVMVVSPSESPHPIDLVVDGAASVLYWIDRDLQMLRASDLDGRDIGDLYPIARPFRGIDVDPHTGMVYWADEVRGSRWIRRGTTDSRNLLFDGKEDFVDLGRVRVDEVAGADASMTVHLRFDVAAPRRGSRQTLISRCSSDGTIYFGVFVDHEVLVVQINGNWVQFGERSDVHGRPQEVTISLGVEGDSTRVNIIGTEGVYGGAVLPTRLIEPPAPTNVADGRWLLGASHGKVGPKEFFDGAIWEAKIWRGEQSEQQMRRVRAGRPSGQIQKQLIGEWRGGSRIGRLVPNLAPGGSAGWRRRKRFDDRLSVPVMRFGTDAGSTLPPTRLELPRQQVSLHTGITFEAWIHAATTPTNHTICDLVNSSTGARLTVGLRESPSGGPGDPYQLAIAARRDGTEPTIEVGAGRVDRDRWVHVAVMCGADGRPTFFVDGAPAPTTPNATLVLSDFEADRAALGGAAVDDDLPILDGMISEARIWSGQLGGDLIRQRLHQRLTGDEPALAGYWPLEERSGATVVASPNGVPALAIVQAVPAAWRSERAMVLAELDALRGILATVPDWPNIENGLVVLEERLGELDRRIASVDPWVLSEVPVARHDTVDRRLTEVVSVPGSDGLSILFTAEYAAARTQQAQAALRLAREKASADLIRARTEAATRREFLEAARAKALFDAEDAKRAASSAAVGERESARNKKADAVAAGEQRKGAAVAQAASIKDKATSVADSEKKAARTLKQRRVADVETRRDAKKEELAAAKKRL